MYYYIMHYFISYKFTNVDVAVLHNFIDPIVELMKSYGHSVFCNLYYDDIYKENNYTPKQIMEHCFSEINKSDILFVLVDGIFGCGMGIEYGYAKCLNKKIVLCKNIDVTSAEWLSDIVIEYIEKDTITANIQKYLEMEKYVKYYIDVNSKRVSENMKICDIDLFVDGHIFSPNPEITIASKIVLDKLKRINCNSKSVLDMGCGTGILGMYCLENGSKVDFTDINEVALKNTEINVSKYSNYSITKSDLFENIHESYDIILFNLPICQEVWNMDVIGMFDRFYIEVLMHLNTDGIAMNVFATFGNICVIRKLLNKYKFNYTEEITQWSNVDWSLFCISK